MNSKNAEIYKNYLIEEKGINADEVKNIFIDYEAGTVFRKTIPISLDKNNSYGISTILGINFEANERNVDISIACLSPNSNFDETKVKKVVELINHFNQAFVYEKLIMTNSGQIILQSCLDIKEKLNPNMLEMYVKSAVNSATRVNREIASILMK